MSFTLSVMETRKYSNGIRVDSTNGNTKEEVKLCTTKLESASSPFQGKAEDEKPTGETEISNDEDVDDDYCVYTYKGDSRGVADLPSSFFVFDQGDSLSSTDENSMPPCATMPMNRRLGYNGNEAFSRSSSATTHHHTRNGSMITVSGSHVHVNGSRPPATDLFSPDMDFLEMDFDPGGPGEDEDLVTSKHEDENMTGMTSTVEKLFDVLSTEEAPCCSSSLRYTPLMFHEIDVTDSPASGLPARSGSNFQQSSHDAESLSLEKSTFESTCVSSLQANPSPRSLDPPSPKPHCSKDIFPNSEYGATAHLNPQLYLGQDASNSQTSSPHIMMRLVKSSTLPEISPRRTEESESRDTETVEQGISLAKNPCLSSSVPVIRNEPGFRAVINTSTPCTSEDDSVEFELGGVMIWTEEDARQRSLSQIGASACGATAVCNVLKALGYDLESAYVNSCVKTRLRDNSAEIPEYLFSRSVAGATHEDLINGIVQASNGLVNGRFFQPKPWLGTRNFCKWLLHWICKGAVPVVTRNMQVMIRPDQPVPDAWHHQMLFGISPDRIFLTNPLENESPSLVISQLTSPSNLLVRRCDVIARKTPYTNLRKLMRHPDPRWNELNVLGQVANILLEEVPVFSSTSIAKRVRTSHITIPASYKGGITLFMPTNSPFFSCCFRHLNYD